MRAVTVTVLCKNDNTDFVMDQLMEQAENISGTTTCVGADWRHLNYAEEELLKNEDIPPDMLD